MKRVLLFLLTVNCFAQSTNLVKVIPSADRTVVGSIQFQAKDATHYVGLSSPDAVATSVMFRLPSTDKPGGGCLGSDGSDNLSIGPCGANATAVSPSNPMLLYVHFRDDDKSHIYLSYSRDYLNYKPLRGIGSWPTTENRDPSIYWDGTTFWIIASPTPANPGLVQLWSTTDLIHFTGPSTLDMSTIVANCNRAWAPEWNPASIGGQMGFWVSLGSPTVSPQAYFISYNPTVGGAFTGTPVTINGTAINLTFDYFPYYDSASAKYYLFYVDEWQAAGGNPYYQKIAYGTSSTLLGPYTQQTPPTSVSSPDHFGFSNTSEGPSIMPLADSVTRYGVADCIRVYSDTWLNMFDNTGNAPRKYLWQYVDTCPATVGGDPFATVKNAPIPVKISASEHGTVIAITDNATANIVYKAEDTYRGDMFNQGRHGVGTDTFSFYTLTVESKYANYFLSYDESATIAAGGVDPGAVHGPKSYATWSACGVDKFSCPPPIGGEDRWIHQYLGTGEAIEMNNSNTDTGESAIMMGNGIFGFGGLPLTASSLGNKAIWSIGENNVYFGPMANGGNVANNWFFVYNRGLGPITGTPPATTNPGFESGNLTGWTATATGQAIVTTPTHSGVYALSNVAAANNAVYQNVSGLISGTTYLITAWIRTSASATVGGYIAVQDTTGANQSTGQTFSPGPFWYQIGMRYVANSTGAVRIQLYASATGTGTVYWDDVQIYAETAPAGAFVLGVSPFTGEVRANYGLTIGQGDSTSLSTANNINLSSATPNVLDIGDGTIGHNNGIVNLGYMNALTGLHLGGTTSTPFVNIDASAAGVVNIGNGPFGNNSATLHFGSLALGGSGWTPAAIGLAGIELSTNGGYGGGWGMIDGTNTIALYSSNGDLNFGFGTTTSATTSEATITKNGYVLASRVGVGTTTPTAEVDVNGVIRSTSAASVPTSGVGLEVLYNGTWGTVDVYDRTASTYGQMRINANPVLLNVGGGAGYPVGINQASPAYQLDVNGTTRAAGSWTGPGATALTGISFIASGPYGGGFALLDPSYEITLSSGSGDLNFSFGALNAAINSMVTITKQGYVLAARAGIGTTAPRSQLSILPVANPNTVATANQITIGEPTNNSAYQFQLGFFVNSASIWTGLLQSLANNAGSALVLNPLGGSVGIGNEMTNPAYQLDVTGTVRGAGSWGGPTSTALANISFLATGPYGGGYGIVDGTNEIALWSGSGDLNFGFGTTTSATTSQATITKNGYVLASRVGIGTPTPIGSLHSNAPSFNPTVNQVAAITANGAYGGGIIINGGSIAAGMWITGGPTTLQIRADGTPMFPSPFGQLSLTAGGNVGINNPSPIAMLGSTGSWTGPSASGNINNISFNASGPYGGGYSLTDGTYTIALSSATGDLSFNFGSNGAVVSKVTMDKNGNMYINNAQLAGQFRPVVVTGGPYTAGSYTKWFIVYDVNGTQVGIVPIF